MSQAARELLEQTRQLLVELMSTYHRQRICSRQVLTWIAGLFALGLSFGAFGYIFFDIVVISDTPNLLGLLAVYWAVLMFVSFIAWLIYEYQNSRQKEAALLELLVAARLGYEKALHNYETELKSETQTELIDEAEYERLRLLLRVLEVVKA